jgi:hypothetical protein
VSSVPDIGTGCFWGVCCFGLLTDQADGGEWLVLTKGDAPNGDDWLTSESQMLTVQSLMLTVRSLMLTVLSQMTLSLRLLT